MTLAGKVETLAWYLRRPHLYREMLRRVASGRITTKRFWQQGARDQEAGRAWCAASLSTQVEVSALLGRGSEELESIARLHPQDWAFAKEAEQRSPVKMGGAAHLDLLYAAVRSRRPDVIVETGVAAGWSTLAMLLALRENGKGHLYSSDMPYAKLNNEDFVGCVVPETLRTRWTLNRRPDRDVLPGLFASLPAVDLVHHDSDKSYEGRMFVYEAGWSKLSNDGLLLSDDIEDNLAFRDFAAKVGKQPFVVEKQPGNFAGLLVK